MAGPRTREAIDQVRKVTRGATTAVQEGVEAGLRGAQRTASVATDVVATQMTRAHAEVAADLAADHARWEARSERTDMPEIGATDPLGDLARRLDRQADFFRELAIDALRPSPTRRALAGLAITLGVVASSAAVLVLVRMGLGWPSPAIGELGAPITAAGALTVVAALVGGLVEHQRMRVAREALARAERVEARLAIVAEWLALEKHSPASLVQRLGAREERLAAPREPE